jgi:hypothetical protein
MPLQEKLGGRSGKGCSPGGWAFAVVHAPTRRRSQRVAKGVLELAEEVVGEELLSK